MSALPSVVRSIEHYLKKQNNMRLRRVAVAVKVLNVDFDERETISFDLSNVMKDLLRDTPFQFTSLAGGLTAGILSSNPSSPLAANFQLTPEASDIAGILTANADVVGGDGIRRISVSNSGAIVTLSDIPAPLQVGQTEAFVERVTAAEGGVSFEPGQVTSGLTMSVLPRVIEEDRVLLRLAIGLTDVLDIQTFPQNAAAADPQVQLPLVDTTGFLQNAVLTEGETLVLAGFERERTRREEAGSPGGILTGGTRTLRKERLATILLIKAEILPEDPFTVVKR